MNSQGPAFNKQQQQQQQTGLNATKIDGYPLWAFSGYIVDIDKRENENTGKITNYLLILAPCLSIATSPKTMLTPEDIEGVDKAYNVKLSFASPRILKPESGLRVNTFDKSKRPYSFLAAFRASGGVFMNKSYGTYQGNLLYIGDSMTDRTILDYLTLPGMGTHFSQSQDVLEVGTAA